LGKIRKESGRGKLAFLIKIFNVTCSITQPNLFCTLLKIWLFGNCRENETGFNTPPNIFNGLAGQARGFAADSTAIPKEPISRQRY
jgi:hypothetical protein